ncbi:uncharacterized protein LOC114559327 [Perca flavescens]|uniref:uncharacterized protein LOC114559327 n=1 Tax=Perca flavescens TaxID=8167 RepID=UPI00106E70DA|nr:uncharacterized protein LOC114559327 [Perca flavescens]
MWDTYLRSFTPTTHLRSFPMSHTQCQSMFNNQSKGLADVWWMCGTQPRLRPSLPAKWGGTCALVSLLLPITMLPISAGKLEETVQSTYHKHSLKRAKRDTDLGFGTWGDTSTPFGSIDSRVYIDAIGIPRGVPEEFKAQNQIAKGFESILPWITTNKNVDWINYIYYNQQRFLNQTRDGLRGVSEQLAASSLMAFQNRMALDMLFPEKGGVCHMFGDACCTFIPNNTAPDGSITRALEGLTSLTNELAENSGVAENLITSWRTFLANTKQLCSPCLCPWQCLWAYWCVVDAVASLVVALW